jgi:hypothetical protein
MNHDDPVRTLLAGLCPPELPQALEVQVLRAAGRALRERRTPDVWERAWASRPLRLAWVAAVLALLAGHAMLSLRPGPDAGSGAWATGRDRLPAEVVMVAELPPIVLSTAAFETAGGGAAAPATRPVGRTEEVRR